MLPVDLAPDASALLLAPLPRLRGNVCRCVSAPMQMVPHSDEDFANFVKMVKRKMEKRRREPGGGAHCVPHAVPLGVRRCVHGRPTRRPSFTSIDLCWP